MSTNEMRDCCHVLAEHILRQRAVGNRGKWLQKEIAEMLLNVGNSDELEADYAAEYEYSDVANPYLADVLKSYDNN